jgi:cytochrome c peroxidase
MRIIWSLIYLLSLSIVIASCDEDQEPPNIRKTDSGPVPILPESNNADEALISLGRTLFYDKALSIDNTVSFSSCHKQSLAFADEENLSTGVQGSPIRNTIAIQNLSPETVVAAGYGSVSVTFEPPGAFFWDGREKKIENLVLQPIFNHTEMGMTNFGYLAKKLGAMPYYRKLFKEAFLNNTASDHNDEITRATMSKALTAFLKQIKSSNSRFDLAVGRGALGVVTDFEFEGFNLFTSTYNCNSCHHVQDITQHEVRFANIGLDADYADTGLERLTKEAGDIGKFKVPSLRNVELTAPYMHDGRFKTLEEVINHYSNSIIDHPNLHPDLKDENGVAKKMNIPEHDVQAIVAFLKTLTDKMSIEDPNLSDPFQKD